MPITIPHSWPPSPSVIQTELYEAPSYPFETQDPFSVLLADHITFALTQGRKRKRSIGDGLGVQLGRPTVDTCEPLAEWEIRPLHYPYRVTHAALLDNWLFFVADDRLSVTRLPQATSGLNKTVKYTYTWSPMDTGEVNNVEVVGTPQGFRTTKECFEVVVSCRVTPRCEGTVQTEETKVVSYHVAFEPAPKVLGVIERSSHPLAFNGKWICFERRDGIRDVHVHRAQDGVVVPLTVEASYGQVEAAFTRRTQSMVVCSTVSNELRVFSAAVFHEHDKHGKRRQECQMIAKIGHAPSALKIAYSTASGPVVLDRTEACIALFTHMQSAPNKAQSEQPYPTGWAKALVEPDHYVGDAVLLPGGRQLAVLLHHRLGERPSQIQTIMLPSFPSPEDPSTDLPLAKASETLYVSDTYENNIILHCDCLIAHASPSANSIVFLVGQRASSSWYYLDCGGSEEGAPSYAGRLIPVDQPSQDRDRRLLPLIENDLFSQVQDVMASLLRRLTNACNWGYTIAQTPLPADDFWDDWEKGAGLRALTSELLLWPTGAMVVLRKYFGIDLNVDLIAAHPGDGVSDFVFAAQADGSTVYFALRIDIEYSVKASDQFQLCRSSHSAVDAAELLWAEPDPTNELLPHPDLVHRFKALKRDIQALLAIGTGMDRERCKGIGKRLEGMIMDVDMKSS